MTRAARTQPVSSHPAFRWIVGLWFAALLGGGLFVMPDAIHASLRQATGLDGLLPGGIAGKAALSGAAALFGMVIGLLIAMRVAALNEAAQTGREAAAERAASVWLDDESDSAAIVPDEGEDDRPRRPFNPREYLADEGIEGAKDESADDEGADDEGEPAQTPAPEPEPAPAACASEDDLPETSVAAALPGDEAPDGRDAPDGERAVIVPDAPPAPEAGHQPTARPVSAVASAEADDAASGDRSLAELAARLERAIAARNAAESAQGSPAEGDVDPVIAFLRREAGRTSPVRDTAGGGDDDPQAVLRGALDRLSQVSNPR